MAVVNDTTIFPWDDIVFIQSTIGGITFQASGVLITPTEVLTAAHVVYVSNLGAATAVQVIPGYNQGQRPFGTYQVIDENYYQTHDTYNFSTNKLERTVNADTAFDFALIHLSEPVNNGAPAYFGVGVSPIPSSGGTVHVTGYPGSSFGALIDSVQFVTQFANQSNLPNSVLQGTSLGAGSSGGPVWTTDAQGLPVLAGVISSSSGSTGFFAEISSITFNQIIAWINEDLPPLVPNPAPPAGTSAELFLRHASDGVYEIYDIGANAILSAYRLGPVGLDWLAAGTGDFNGDGSSDLISRQNVTGTFEVYDVSGNNIVGAASLGTVGLDWKFAGLGDFNADGTSDMMLRQAATGSFEVYNIKANQIASAANIGTVGNDWQVAGFGDFNGDGSTDMMLRQDSTGSFGIYSIANSRLTAAYSVGTVGTDWLIAGFADFNRDGTTDMMLRQASTGSFEVYNIKANQIVSASNIGAVGNDWQVAGFGDLNGDGTKDMLLRQTATGTFEDYTIVNSQLVSAHNLGTVGTDWQIAGIGAPSGFIASQSALVSVDADTPGSQMGQTAVQVSEPSTPSYASESFVFFIPGPRLGIVYTGTPMSDTFVFSGDSGMMTIAQYEPGQDHIQTDHTLFATVAELLAHTSDDGLGNAVITVDAQTAITVQGVTLSVLQHHLDDFIIT